MPTDTGTVVGSLGDKTRSFLGIPYAAPPLGPLRFAPPAAHARWSQPLVAKKLQPTCPQGISPFTSNLDQSEDCLTLNVWTPRPAPKNAPVMVFIHGGAFVVGAGGDLIYQGTALASHGVVVVTLNYRLGALGYLGGNWGIQDQRAALQWVQRNIAAFGGDPANVTLFGESAGGISVLVHMVSPPSAGLFHRAIVESGPLFTAPNHSMYWQTQAQAAAHGATFMQNLGCSDLDCMRNQPIDPLIQGQGTMGLNLRGFAMTPPWWPFIDGTDVPAAPPSLLQSGNLMKVPVIIGTNRDEGTLFEKVLTPVVTDADYTAEMMAPFAAQTQAVLGRYPSSSFPTPGDAAAAVYGDNVFTCDTRRIARALAAAGVPVWRYHFEHLPEMPLFGGVGVHHAAELAFVFENRFMAAAELPLAEQIETWWTNFAKTGDPGSDWPSYDATTDRHLVIDTTPHVAEGVSTELCDFWDALPPP